MKITTTETPDGTLWHFDLNEVEVAKLYGQLVGGLSAMENISPLVIAVSLDRHHNDPIVRRSQPFLCALVAAREQRTENPKDTKKLFALLIQQLSSPSGDQTDATTASLQGNGELP